MSRYDVIIIGSGPAGCSAAATCALAGLKVLLLSEQDDPLTSTQDEQPVIESIHPGVTSVLHQVKLAGAENYATRGRYPGIYADQKYSSLGHDEQGPWLGMHIDKTVFIKGLIDGLKKFAVDIRFNERVDDFLKKEIHVTGVKTKTGEFHSTYVIDASGKKSIAGKKLNFKRRFFSPSLHCWTGISGGIKNFPFEQSDAHFISYNHSWTWYAPLPPEQCAWTRLQVTGEKDFSSPPLLASFPVEGKILMANMRWRLFRPVCSEGILLCGDAAGILDPAAGQGIFNALRSGIIAAQTVIKCLHQPDLASFHLAYYDDWFSGQFEEKARQLRTYYAEHNIDLVNY